MISRRSGGGSDDELDLVRADVLFPGSYHRAVGVVCVTPSVLEGVATSSAKVNQFDLVQSLLLRRGETLFPFSAYDVSPDWKEVYRCWVVFSRCYDRFMKPSELLLLYDGDLERV